LDENDKPIFFATAVLYNQSDSTIAKSTSTGEDGKFKIENIKPGKYYLELRFLGYQNKKIAELEFPKDSDSNYPVKMEQETNQLSEVEVTGKSPY
jgi:hypothetical protein